MSKLKAAIAAVKAKVISAAAASRNYGIPASTLHCHLVGKSKRRYGGRGQLLTAMEEKEIERVWIKPRNIGVTPSGYFRPRLV